MADATTCRRCSDCVGQEHHWMENYRVVDEGDPYFICKHCDAACGEANPDEGVAEPNGILIRQSPICEGCDWYLKDCECDLDDEPDDGVDERGGCLDSTTCCNPHPFHTAEECEFPDDHDCGAA